LSGLGPLEVAADIRSALPFPDNSFHGAQSQDVLEHVPFERAIFAVEELVRVVRPGATIRISVPDYRAELNRSSSVYDDAGKILCDLRMGGAVVYESGSLIVQFAEDGDAHLWFPTLELMKQLLAPVENRCDVQFLHYIDPQHGDVKRKFLNEPFFVSRIPELDFRANGRPLSIVVDLTKK
jgi:SAM-dependent methyltransferase